MRVVVVTLALACLAACQFDTKPVGVKQPSSARTSKNNDSGAAAMDAGVRQASRQDAASATGSLVFDASTGDGGTSSNPPDGATSTPADAGADTATPLQNGGLMCSGVFCPFANDPIKPCCTSRSDVEQGSARSKNRCGLDFSATGKDFFSDLCWQRDQTGVIDPSCTDVAVDLHTNEPGCCSEQGRCGGVNTDQALGCHYDPTAPSKSCGSLPDEPDGGSSCDPRGVYGVRLEVDLAWGGRTNGLAALTDDGRGKQVVYLMTSIDDIDSSSLELNGQVRVCGVTLPTFYSTTLCEAYEPLFPNTMWESSAMPRFPLHGRMQCVEPGCIASFDAETVLLGIELSNPEAPWPTSDMTTSLKCPDGTGVNCFPDHDGDMRAGLSTTIATNGIATGGTGCSGSYTKNGAPLSASIAAIFGGVRRTDRLSLGVRMKIGGSAKLTTACGGGSGAGIAEFVNSRSIGCLVEQGTFDFGSTAPAGPNDACTATEAGFMDSNLPIYTVLAVGKTPSLLLNLSDRSVSKGPQLHVARLGDLGADISCAEVRAATYP